MNTMLTDTRYYPDVVPADDNVALLFGQRPQHGLFHYCARIGKYLAG